MGNNGFSVYICNEELIKRNFDPEHFTAKAAAELLKDTLPEKEAGQRMQVELFTGREETLLFVRLNTGKPEFFAFPDAESLIGAVTESRGLAPSFLTYINDMYILTVYPFPGDGTAVLEEFGIKLLKEPEFELHLREHGEFILENEDISALRRAFSAKKA